jgi:hypothetical protein
LTRVERVGAAILPSARALRSIGCAKYCGFRRLDSRLGAVLAFDVPVKPPPLASISEPFAGVDFSEELATDGDVE